MDPVQIMLKVLIQTAEYAPYLQVTHFTHVASNLLTLLVNSSPRPSTFQTGPYNIFIKAYSPTIFHLFPLILLIDMDRRS